MTTHFEVLDILRIKASQILDFDFTDLENHNESWEFGDLTQKGRNIRAKFWTDENKIDMFWDYIGGEIKIYQ